MQKLETIHQALHATEERLAQSPSDPALLLVKSQLNYVRKVLSGKRPYRFRLSRIQLDRAGTEFFLPDSSYTSLLSQSQKVADELTNRG